MRFRAAIVGALSATLLLTAMAVPSAAQLAPTPKPLWPDGSSKLLHLNYMILGGGGGCVNGDGISSDQSTGYTPYYLHADAHDICSLDGEPTQPTSNVANGRPYKIALQPLPSEAIPLVPGAKINVTLWVGHEGLAGQPMPNDLNVNITLRQGTASVSTGSSGAFDPASLAANEQWYKFEVQLDPPGGPAILNTTEPWHLLVDQLECFDAGTPNAGCLADSPTPNSVGNKWRLGFRAEHASTIELPIPDAFVSGKPWPPITCASNEALNLTTKKCDKVVVECPDDEVLNETSGLCEAVQVVTLGPEGPTGGITHGDNVTTQGNDTTNGTKDQGLPAVGTVGLLAATFVAFVAAGRRRRDD